MAAQNFIKLFLLREQNSINQVTLVMRYSAKIQFSNNVNLMIYNSFLGLFFIKKVCFEEAKFNNASDFRGSEFRDGSIFGIAYSTRMHVLIGFNSAKMLTSGV